MNLKPFRALLIASSAMLFLAACDQLSSDSSNGGEDVSNSGPAPTAGSMKIGYVNNDSLVVNSKMKQDLDEELMTETTVLENQFRTEYERFEQDYLDAQSQASMLSESELQRLQGILQQKEYNLQMKKQQLDEQLYASQERKMEKFYTSVREFLDEYAAAEGYEIIYGYNGLGNVLYMDPKYDITNIIVDSLNHKYESEKNNPEADPTAETANE